mgnify:CR=1 FL=1
MDIFIEEMVLKKKTAGNHIVSLALMFAGLLVVMALLFFLPLLPQLAPFILLLIAGGVLFIRFVMTSGHIEYEYALVNDELDVDKILGRRKRKKIISISVKDPEASFVFITVTDMSDLNKQVGRLAILGSGKQLYCFERAIAVARVFVSVEENGEKTSRNLTEICRFNINGSSISFAGTYVVDGSLIGGVSVNGENDHMAVVTSVSDSNNLYVFDMNMEFVSGLKHIFKGKKVDTVRFIGHDCCLTSGEETMIIKLESPKFPKNAGTVPSELFTGNLYEISESRLLGIKTDSSGNTVLRLIDASNPQNLSGVSEYVIDSSYKVLSASDSRNVMIAPDKGIIGVFVLASDTETGVKYPAYMIFKVTDGEIAFAGVCRHDDAYVSDTAVSAIYNNGVIYTVSGEKVAAFSADDFSEISSCEIR